MKERLGVTLSEVGVRRGKRWVLKRLCVNFRAGERWALTGGNGAGKTQMLKLLGTEIWPTPTGRERRIYRLGGRKIEESEAKPLIAHLGAELQDKYARYGWNFSLRDIVATGLHNTDIPLAPLTRSEGRIVAAMLRECGLMRLGARRFLSLSYGQQRLALLARALVRKPHWLLLDELYNGLDDKYRRKVDAILARARKRGQSWVVAAHRAMDVPAGTTRLLQLESGRIRAKRELKAADLARLLEAPDENAGRVSSARGVSPPGASPLVRLREADLYVEYRPVLRRVDWQLMHGEQWAVLGENGAGKSSFLKLLYGDLSPAIGGIIERAGIAPGTPIEQWKRSVGYISPELQSDYAIDVSILDMVVSGRHASVGLNDAPVAEDLRRARFWLDYFNLAHLEQHRPRELSYGQMRRALFARALAGAPRMLLLDEPLTGLDPEQRAMMRGLLSGLMARGISIVMAVHHIEDLPAGITHALRLHNRKARAIPLRIAN
jgi:molybdate transport system ATP-binding protein